MFYSVGHTNTLCRVFNTDQDTKDDYGVDFPSLGLIGTLGLTCSFNNITFENVPISLIMNEDALHNAFYALKSGGIFYAFPVPQDQNLRSILQKNLSQLGFTEIKFNPQVVIF